MKKTFLFVIAAVLIFAGVGVLISVSSSDKSNGVGTPAAGNENAETVQNGVLSYTDNGSYAKGTYTCKDRLFQFKASVDVISFSSSFGGYLTFNRLRSNQVLIEFQVAGGPSKVLSLLMNEPEEMLDDDIQNSLQALVVGNVGSCLVETVFQLSSRGIVTKDRPHYAPLFGLARILYNFAVNSQQADWDFPALKALFKASNDAVRKLRSEERKLLTCSTSEWFKLADGKCDSAFNNAQCNFDNGDCCPKTCRDYASRWGGVSPPDGSGVTHPVYDCSTVTEATCVPSCTVSDRTRLGDGRCDSDLNNEACGYDLGDCCEETCESRSQECGVGGYNCISGAEGNCFRAYYCDNPYFGGCGLDADCWLSLCGDCRCHYQCQDHDKYCSCRSLFSSGCLNVFRDWCGDN